MPAVTTSRWERLVGAPGGYKLRAPGLGEPGLRVTKWNEEMHVEIDKGNGGDMGGQGGGVEDDQALLRALTWKPAENRTCESGAGRKIVPGGFYSVVRKAGGKSYL